MKHGLGFLLQVGGPARLAQAGVIALLAAATQPALAQGDDPLGVRWLEEEGVGSWSAVWTRRGSTGVFDASWNNGRITAVLTISISGSTASVARRQSSDGNDCDYTGTVSGNRVEGTYTCTNGGPYEWSATIEHGFSGDARTVDEAAAAKCSAQTAAQEELVIRARAAHAALQSLLAYRSALDEAYEASRESAFVDRAVDVAALAAGWPLGKAAETAVLGEVKQQFTEKLLKAGLKGIEKRLLKDPTLGGVFEQVTTSAGRLEGLEFDLTKQAMKDSLTKLLGSAAGESAMGALDLILFGYKTYKGMKVLDAYRLHSRQVGDQILAMERAYASRTAIATRAQSAVEQCLHRLSLGLEPDPAEYNWVEVQAYLRLPHDVREPERSSTQWW